MENLVSYIKNERARNEKDIVTINEKISNIKYNIENIENMIVELSKNIDTTYEVFSPNAFDKDYNIVEIEKLNLKKNELLAESNTLGVRRTELLDEKQRLDVVHEELMDMEKQLAGNVKNTQYLIEKERKRNYNEYSDSLTTMLEYQIKQQNHYLNRDLKKELDLLENKITMCENFMDIDVNRAKLEICKLKDEISDLEKSVMNKMFHVKHSLKDEKLNLYDCVKEFVQSYKKVVRMKLEFKYSGEKIMDSSKNVINMIRILKEAIDNAEKHSNGSIITINIVIDDFVPSDINDNYDFESKMQSENVNDMHQINFIVEDTKEKYNVTIKVSDNGEGFALQEENVLIENELFGIYIMRYRSKLIEGTFNIESELGLGTTVTLVYQTSV